MTGLSIPDLSELSMQPEQPIYTDPASGRRYAVDPRTGQPYWLDQVPFPVPAPVEHLHQPQPSGPRRSGARHPWLIGGGVIVGLFTLLVIIGAIVGPPKTQDTAASTTGGAASSTPSRTQATTRTTPSAVVTHAVQPSTTAKPATPVATPYPPTTTAGFLALARTGDATAVHVFKRESVGLVGVCPQPALHATISAGLTSRQVVADEAAEFVSEGLQNNQCGAVLWLYHAPSEDGGGDGYTAGMVNLDRGAGNIEVDAGNAVAPAEQFTVPAP